MRRSPARKVTTGEPEKSLSVAEQILRLQDMWDALAASPDSIEVTPMQRSELRRRRRAHARTPDDTTPWSEVKRSVRKRP